MFAVLFASTYSFWIYPNSEFGLNQETNTAASYEPPLNPNYKLADFRFLNGRMDTVLFTKMQKPVLIETWNETWGPCIQSIRDLQSTFSQDTSFNHVYLYQYRGKKKIEMSSIFHYKEILQKEKILLDIENKLFKKLGMNSYPYFLVFDSTGRLTAYHAGYKSSRKDEVLKRLQELIRSAQSIN